ncbi:AbrB/MazE/SpoVT family DNA-binding domain-containing protein [Limosilactobacillus reuteri]|uniref:AbrB/MazE/SpoVT family DNA-binding domain-containing protein n=1 Tax=Limosilactobacillus reuteri TaxID=1598 RepID=UPI000A1E7C3A|nr:AbrB/MazE/SpoVT family DNA-binding domain-containing protein [Limosilactobacillus reuteri]
MTAQTLKLGKWGNSSAIRLPKKMLRKIGIAPNDEEIRVEITNDSIVIKPQKKQKALEKLFANYDSNQPYPYEIVDKGGAIGEELY